MLKIFILTILSFGSCCVVSGKSNEICWDSERLLTLDDFKGKPPSHTANAAITHISIGYETISRNRLRITNCMVNDESWVKPEHRTNEILMHEQYHFHIAEVFARRMRREMSGLETLTPANAKSIFNKWIKKYNSEQASYDKETKHSQSKAAQARWEKKIDLELKELDLYKEAYVDIGRK